MVYPYPTSTYWDLDQAQAGQDNGRRKKHGGGGLQPADGDTPDESTITKLTFLNNAPKWGIPCSRDAEMVRHTPSLCAPDIARISDDYPLYGQLPQGAFSFPAPTPGSHPLDVITVCAERICRAIQPPPEVSGRQPAQSVPPRHPAALTLTPEERKGGKRPRAPPANNSPKRPGPPLRQRAVSITGIRPALHPITQR